MNEQHSTIEGGGKSNNDPEPARKPTALLTLDEAAAELRICRATLNAWIVRGKVSVVRFSRKKVFMRPIDIEKAKERFLETGPSGKKQK